MVHDGDGSQISSIAARESGASCVGQGDDLEFSCASVAMRDKSSCSVGRQMFRTRSEWKSDIQWRGMSRSTKTGKIWSADRAITRTNILLYGHRLILSTSSENHNRVAS